MPLAFLIVEGLTPLGDRVVRALDRGKGSLAALVGAKAPGSDIPVFPINPWHDAADLCGGATAERGSK